MTGEPLVVVGIGHDGPAGLAPQARAHVAAARVLAGGRRHLDFFADWPGERIVLAGDLGAGVARLRACYRQEKTVVLASGDPLFYGIGKLLLEAFPRDELLFLPAVSSVQLAFARVKEPWHDAVVVSLHGRPLEALLPALRAREGKIAVLTDPCNGPAAIAELLRGTGAAEDYALWVCENLGGPDERLSRHRPTALLQDDFSPLNVVLLLREPGETVPDVPLLGIPEEALLHRGDLITRREVRLLALCRLELRPGEVLWDVGAGSGSVAIEAARLSPALDVYAVERDPDAFGRLRTNLRRFAPGVQAVAGAAPAALAGLPDPDAVFVGGSGGALAGILAEVGRRLRPGGRVVLCCISVENFAAAWARLGELGLGPEATSVQLARSRPLGRLHCLEPDSLLFLLRGRKPGEEG
jgi:precorrin-6Y C5,15-methyltransferase (decarboxylating)